MADGGLADALATEYEAIYAYSSAGAHLTGALLDAAKASERAHRDRRDAVIVHMTDTGATVPAELPAYRLTADITDEASASQTISEVEDRTCQAWRAVLPNVGGKDRRAAVQALADGAVTAARWRRAVGDSPATTAFPGRP